jgi:signal transduction histidine kinase
VLGLGNAHLFVFDRNDALTGSDISVGCYHELLQNEGLRAVLREGSLITSDNSDAAAGQCRAVIPAKSFALVPGIAGSRLACVLCADDGGEPYEFHASASRFLQALASQTAMALENASLVDELKKNNDELASANNKLRELDMLKSQFLSVATHELRTPLSVILGYNAMLAESLQDRLTEDEKDTIRESVVACKRLIRLVNSMLDITQIESGKMRMTFAPANLKSLVEGIASLFQHEAVKKQIALHLDVSPKLPRVMIDAERMQQVLINLVGNALKFTPAGGSIELAAGFDHNAHAIQLSVSDTGVGIAAEDQGCIFDEFAQIRRQNALRQREGSGLGLAISKRIVEAHEGRIEVSSEPGKGCRFTVIVPAKPRWNASSTAMTA